MLICDGCGEIIKWTDCLRLGDAHPDLCPARPTLMSIHQNGNRWIPVLRAGHTELTKADHARIVREVKELIALDRDV